jgi:hypothetical protein
MIDLPRGTAVWVLSAHVLTVCSPLVVVWAVVHYREPLDAVLYSSGLLLAACGLQVTGSLFESMQNHRDDWYLTNNDRSLLDGAFNVSIVTSLVLTALACQGQYFWLWPAAFATAVLYGLFYWRDLPKEALQALAGLMSTVCLYLSFRDPVVLLPLLAVFLTLYFLDLLIRTGAQSLHGFTTIVNGLGLMAIPWAIINHVSGQSLGWAAAALIFLAVTGLALALRPALARLAATQRSGGSVAQAA